MAITFAGGTDKIAYGAPGAIKTSGWISFKFKTTQTTANAVLLGLWRNISRDGIGFILNNTAGKMLVQCYGGTGTPAISMTGTPTINDGAWHTAVLNWNIASGSANTLYIDGALAVTANAGATWDINAASSPLELGRVSDAFWPSYVGSLAEVAVGYDRNLTADEIAALSNFSPLLATGYSPGVPSGLSFYAPLIRSANNLFDSTITGPTGTSVSDHPRVIGF